MELKEHFKKWCKDFSDCKTEPMTEEISKFFLQSFLLERQNILTEDPPELKDSFGFQVITGRAASMKLDITPLSKVFISGVVDTPGSAVMYLSYLKNCQLETGKKITMTEITNLFPLGFLTKEELNKMWDQQKTKDHKNMLDLITY